MKKSLLAIVFLAAGVSLANAQSTEKARKLKTDKAIKTEVKAEENTESASVVAAPTFKKGSSEVQKAEETAALKTETAAELKTEPAAQKAEEKN